MRKYQGILLAVISAFLFGGYSGEITPMGDLVPRTSAGVQESGIQLTAKNATKSIEDRSLEEEVPPEENLLSEDLLSENLLSEDPEGDVISEEILEGEEGEAWWELTTEVSTDSDLPTGSAPDLAWEELSPVNASVQEMGASAYEMAPLLSEEMESVSEEEEGKEDLEGEPMEGSYEMGQILLADSAGVPPMEEAQQAEEINVEDLEVEDIKIEAIEEESVDSGLKSAGSGEESLEALAASKEPEEEKLPNEKKKTKAMKKAAALALQYDYEGAMETLWAVKNYANDEEMVAKIREYKQKLKDCVEYPLEKITHVFFHSLIVDTSRAFDGDYNSDGYNQVMTTVKEFRKMLTLLYARGYVLVSPHDMAYKDENGVMQRGTILLPEGKTPLVLSQDDVSYYHYMDGDGLASKLVLDENGEVKCEYVKRDGGVVVGDYDMVPIVDTFIKEHPDFSYHGRKGILAMTGYNGVLGYRTDKVYKTRQDLDELQQAFLDAHPDFDFD